MCGDVSSVGREVEREEKSETSLLFRLLIRINDLPLS